MTKSSIKVVLNKKIDKAITDMLQYVIDRVDLEKAELAEEEQDRLEREYGRTKNKD